MELKREIISQDIPRIESLVKLASVNREEGAYKGTFNATKEKGTLNYDPKAVITNITRLGGMTNHSYKVSLSDSTELLVRIPGDGTEEMISRSDERKSTELACRLHLDSDLYWFGDDGTKVMRFIRNPQSMSEEVMRRSDNIFQAAKIFKTLHTCGTDTGVRFEVFEMADLYEKIIKENNVKLYDDYENVKGTVFQIKEAVDKTGIAKRVPCHNDSLIGNWVLDENDRLYLIDWEYSGMNEPMWDLSCLSIECDYTPLNDEELLKDYYGEEATTEQKKRFIAAKLYVDYLWTLWGLTRVPFDGQFMQDYADNRYTRLKKNIEAYEAIEKKTDEKGGDS